MQDGKNCIVDTLDGPLAIRARHVVLAPGSVSVELPALPFGGPVITSTEALALEALPERLVVVGGGYIGLELGSAFAKLGVTVTVVEALDRLLPQYDAELSRVVAKNLKQLGVEVLTKCRARRLSDDGAALQVDQADGSTLDLPADKVLVTVGRKARLQGWGLSELGLVMDGSFVRVDAQCRTSMTDVYAIGDVTRGADVGAPRHGAR